ncbi:hypothetical protein BC332_21233 [Capsicum chinense]|nr:hypothetical protein BC332_21233 [Capsicum chinense]
MENMCKEGEKSMDQPLLDKVPVRGMIVDLLETTINRFLRGPEFTPQATSPKFYARLKHRANQWSWLTTLITEGKLEWLNNLNERIFKASLTQEARFWWGVLCTHLMPIEGDNIIGDDRAILVTNFVAKLSLNFGEIIVKEMKIWVSRLDMEYPFPCLIMRLCQADVGVLQQHQLIVSADPVVDESEGEIPLVDITGEPVKKNKKKGEKKAIQARAVGALTSRPPTIAGPNTSEQRETPDGDKVAEDAAAGSGTHDPRD